MAQQQGKLRSPTRKRLVVGNENLVNRTQVDAVVQALRAISPNSDEDPRTLAWQLLMFNEDELNPWLEPAKLANARYFIKQEGAAELLIGLVNDRFPEAVLNQALYTLWTLSVSEEVSLVLVELGVLAALVGQLRSSKPDIVSAALGAFWGFVEFPSVVAQAAACGISNTFTQLILQEEEANNNNPVSLMGCFMSLTFDPDLRRELVESDAPEGVIALLDAHVDEPLVQYTGIIALAFLLLERAHEERLQKLGVLDRIATYLELSPQTVARHNEDGGMVWKFIRPFFGLMTSRHASVRRLCGLVYAGLALTPVHRPLFMKEGLVASLLAVSWSTTDEGLRTLIQSAVAHLAPLPSDPPSLVELCAFRLRQSLPDQGRLSLLPRDLHERFVFTVPL